MTAEIIDFTAHLATKQRREIKQWLDQQKINSTIPCSLPEDFFDDEELEPDEEEEEDGAACPGRKLLSLVEANDKGDSFKKIAERLRKYPERYFTNLD